MADSGSDLGMTSGAPRRPPRQLAIVIVLLAAALFAVIVGSSGGPHSEPATASPTAVFLQDPYMGVSCPFSNSIACDRVGLSVWLARRATVQATIGGARFRLDAPRWSYVAHQGGRPLYVYAGFLQPAGITTRLHVVPGRGSTWLGANAPAPLVRFRIDYGNGRVVVTRERVWLHAGWG